MTQVNMKWRDVVDSWRDREANIWDSFIEEHGYKDWDDFRVGQRTDLPGILDKYGFYRFPLENLNWRREEIAHDALKLIHCGPFNGWKYYTGKSCSRFWDMMQTINGRENHRVIANMRTLKSPGELNGIALRNPETGYYVLLDGCHTVSSFCLAALTGNTIRKKLVLHCADIEAYEFDHFVFGGGLGRT